jgi:hypothetical protein
MPIAEDLQRAKELLTNGRYCLDYRPDHNGECLNCDEWADAHELPTLLARVVAYSEAQARQLDILQAGVEDAAKAIDEMQAEIERLKAEVETLRGR